jgi:hypothetical protein
VSGNALIRRLEQLEGRLAPTIQILRGRNFNDPDNKNSQERFCWRTTNAR